MTDATVTIIGGLDQSGWGILVVDDWESGSVVGLGCAGRPSGNGDQMATALGEIEGVGARAYKKGYGGQFGSLGESWKVWELNTCAKLRWG